MIDGIARSHCLNWSMPSKPFGVILSSSLDIFESPKWSLMEMNIVCVARKRACFRYKLSIIRGHSDTVVYGGFSTTSNVTYKEACLVISFL